MKRMQLGTSELEVSNISLGCMRLSGLTDDKAKNVVHHAMDLGINFYDHADIYGGGASEEIFAKAVDMNPSTREKMILQSKCGIRNGFFDFSTSHILSSVDSILQRLQTDYLDVLLLHRPDALMEPEEVAEAFSSLEKSGKVRNFGVSNHNPMQIELLKKYVEQDLIVNQLQLSVMHTGMIDTGLQVNTKHPNGVDRDGSVLDYSRLNNMTIQAWSPFQYGFFEGVFIDNDKFPELNSVLGNIAEKYNVTKTTIAVAWILRHPAKIQTVVGTMNTERLSTIADASELVLSREEWYEIYRAAGNELP
ncbi:Oxidoreductase YdhF [Oceanobacillus picturae]|uniref:Oxidoreductase YdhF n=1 Tax=Oceanobacillus picturae TaxID=171693 RepID=W9AIT7_9BACI|nr:aldo/keto reductase [Oceanobacillus picturae]RIU89432.1 aldo/keto reductase family oxidoreductase [Oceanobacillus picturae]CDO02852.1 Oxidoreductase YdhF [Oceanobacillus picturae]